MSFEQDRGTRSIITRSEGNEANRDQDNFVEEAAAKPITVTEFSHDFLYCPSPDLEVYDETILIDDDPTIISRLPLNNLTSESVILQFAGQIFNGQHSSYNNSTKGDNSTMVEENENRNDSELVIISPPVVKSSRSDCLKKKFPKNPRIPIHVSPSVTIVQETDSEDNEDENDICAHECGEDREEQPNNIQSYQIKDKGVKNKSTRKWRKEKPIEENDNYENLVTESRVRSVWTSTPHKRNGSEREIMSSCKNASIHLNSENNPSFFCKTPLPYDLEMRCAWHEWQVDYVSLVKKDDLIKEPRTFSKEWFALHQPLKEDDGREEDEKDEKLVVRDERVIENVDNSYNDTFFPKLKCRSKQNHGKFVNMQIAGNFGKQEKCSQEIKINRCEYLRKETWVMSSDFCVTNFKNRQRKMQRTSTSENDESVIILNYLKIRNFKPKNRNYTTFFDPSFKRFSPKTKSNFDEEKDKTTQTARTTWYHFFRFCYSSLPHLSSLDYDYRLEWSDSNRVDHYRLAHPIFIPEALKWIHLLTHPDGATVYGLQTIE